MKFISNFNVQQTKQYNNFNLSIHHMSYHIYMSCPFCCVCLYVLYEEQHKHHLSPRDGLFAQRI